MTGDVMALERLIAKLPPGRAKRRYEAELDKLLRQLLGLTPLDSQRFGGEAWLAQDESAFQSARGCAVYLPEELRLTEGLSSETLDQVNRIKRFFPGSRLVDGIG